MNNKFPHINLTKLKDLYLNTNLPISHISKELGYGTKTVKKWIKRMNIERTPEHLLLVNKERYERRKNNMLKLYGVTNKSKLDNVRQSISNGLKQTWSTKPQSYRQDIVDKLKCTKQLRYGNPNYNNMKKNRETKLKRYGDEKYNNLSKNVRTRSLNRSSGKSKLEDKCYEILCNHYNNVTRHIHYNFSEFDLCVDSLYIEINGVFWHNYRPFIECEEHIKEYNELMSKGGMYESIAKHWRYDDPRKLQYCKENNLNLLVIYCTKLPLNIIDLVKLYKEGITIIIYKNNNLKVQRLSKV